MRQAALRPQARRRRSRRRSRRSERARRSAPCYAREVQASRVAVLAACGLVAAAGVWWLGGALAQDSVPAPATADAHVLTEAAKAGRHWRVDGPRGPIHVWVPPGYRAETAATILYIHGYYD